MSTACPLFPKAAVHQFVRNLHLTAASRQQSNRKGRAQLRLRPDSEARLSARGICVPTSVNGTKRTSGNVRPMSAFGGEADIRTRPRLSLMTESGHLA